MPVLSAMWPSLISRLHIRAAKCPGTGAYVGGTHPVDVVGVGERDPALVDNHRRSAVTTFVGDLEEHPQRLIRVQGLAGEYRLADYQLHDGGPSLVTPISMRVLHEPR